MKYAGNKNSARIVTLSELGTHTLTQNTSNNKNNEIKDTHIHTHTHTHTHTHNKVIKRKEITLDALAAD